MEIDGVRCFLPTSVTHSVCVGSYFNGDLNYNFLRDFAYNYYFKGVLA